MNSNEENIFSDKGEVKPIETAFSCFGSSKNMNKTGNTGKTHKHDESTQQLKSPILIAKHLLRITRLATDGLSIPSQSTGGALHFLPTGRG
jgi:hypothetical protein